MLNVCFNKTFYTSFKIAKNQGLIEESKILLIQEDLLLDNMSFTKYINTISDSNGITIWYSSSSPKELYYLYFIVNKFINKNIKVVTLDKKYIKNGYLKYSCSGDVSFKDIPYFIQNKKTLTLEEKKIYLKKYLEILQQKGDLLVIVNGGLKIVESNFYDSEILEFVSYDNWFYIYEVIGQFLSFKDLDINDDFALNRLMSLEKVDLVEINFNHNEIYYSKIIKRYNIKIEN